MIHLNDDNIRQELKFKIFDKDFVKFESWLVGKSPFLNHMILALCLNLFDDPNYSCAASNMSGESERIKIRARWYE